MPSTQKPPMSLLHLDASPRGNRSVSNTLAAEFVAAWKTHHPEKTVLHRDLGSNPPAPVSLDWVVGVFAPPEDQTEASRSALAASDAYVEEFLAADLIVAAVPIYNLGVPAQFKAYIDQIIRRGKTFGVSEQGYVPLVHGKKLLVTSASGGSFKLDGPAAAYNFHEPYLRAIFGFIGITDVTVIYADNQNTTEEAREEGLAEARKKIADIAPLW